jgi:hypothetical protein
MCQRGPMSCQYVGKFIDLYLPVFAQCDISLHQYGVIGCVVVKLGVRPVLCYDTV